MCLAVPGKIVKIEENKKKAIADFMGIKRKIDISLLEECSVSDYVLVHVGFAIQKIDEKTAKQSYRLLDEFEKTGI